MEVRKNGESVMKYLHLGWEDIQKLCESVARKIAQAGYRPDIIIAISRGGFPPGRVLCDLLGISRLASLQIEYYKGPEETGDRPVIVIPLNINVKGARVLIVDDVADTGHSLQEAKKNVLERRPSQLKVATLHYKPGSVFKPDFYAEVTRAWIVYPWEVMETIKKKASDLRNEGKNARKVEEELLRLGFSKGKVKEALGRSCRSPS
ncbi:MAG: phosphoribosyltransferase [Candidatus Bathyarchaeia archaeon]